MTRRLITVGDLTTANGVVVAASAARSVDGRQVAVEGDSVACRSCHSSGYILCDDGVFREKSLGRLLALEGDFCICRCQPPPRLLATQPLCQQAGEA